MINALFKLEGKFSRHVQKFDRSSVHQLEVASLTLSAGNEENYKRVLIC